MTSAAAQKENLAKTTNIVPFVPREFVVAPFFAADKQPADAYAASYRRLVLRNPRYGLFYTAEARGIVVHAVCDLAQPRQAILRHLDL